MRLASDCASCASGVLLTDPPPSNLEDVRFGKAECENLVHPTRGNWATGQEVPCRASVKKTSGDAFPDGRHHPADCQIPPGLIEIPGTGTTTRFRSQSRSVGPLSHNVRSHIPLRRGVSALRSIQHQTAAHAMACTAHITDVEASVNRDKARLLQNRQ